MEQNQNIFIFSAYTDACTSSCKIVIASKRPLIFYHFQLSAFFAHCYAPSGISWSLRSNREDICLQTLLLLFKYANHKNKRSFVSTVNEALVGTVMTVGDVNNIFPISNADLLIWMLIDWTTALQWSINLRQWITNPPQGEWRSLNWRSHSSTTTILSGVKRPLDVLHQSSIDINKLSTDSTNRLFTSIDNQLVSHNPVLSDSFENMERKEEAKFTVYLKLTYHKFVFVWYFREL